MKTKSPWILLVLAALPVVLAGCGGGSGGGIGGTGDEVVSVGPITRFGSVVVNGVEFRTGAETQVEVEDVQAATEGDLRIGMVVEVRGRLDESGPGGVADLIRFERNLEGPIAAKDEAAATLTVLGQSVLAEEAVFEGTTFGALAEGHVVEVSGQTDAGGAIRATFIKKKAPGGVLELRGTVSSHDPQSRTFFIGAQQVSYDGVEPRNGAVGDGAVVEVKGTDGAGVLVASEVEIKEPSLAANMKVEIEGFVRGLSPPATFKVNGRSVDASRADFGEDAVGDLADNVKVEVEGTIDASGVIVADTVQIKRPRNIKIVADVQAKDETSVTLLGVRVLVGRATQFDRSFGLASINPGDRIEVRAYRSASGNVVASRIEREGNPGAPVVIQGVATSLRPDVIPGALLVLGVRIELGVQTQFKDLEDQPIPPDQFLSQLVGLGAPVVKARGIFSAGAIAAAEVSLEGPKASPGSN